MTPWQGGTQVTAFVTGGFVPPELRGTSNSALMHVAGTSFDLTYISGSLFALLDCLRGSSRLVSHSLHAGRRVADRHGRAAWCRPDAAADRRRGCLVRLVALTSIRSCNRMSQDIDMA